MRNPFRFVKNAITTASAKAVAKETVREFLAQASKAPSVEFMSGHGEGVSRPERTKVDPAEFYRTNPSFYRAVKRVADAVSMLPFTVYRDGKEPTEENGRAQERINRPNDYQTWMDFCRGVVTYDKIHGDNYILLEGVGSSDRLPPAGLHLLDPRMVSPIPDSQDRIKGFKYQVNGRTRKLQPTEVIHIQEFSPTSPYIGVGAGEALQNTLYLERCANEYNTNGFEQGGA
ncbi:MAG: phage portal protein, partial [bacterium]|nr:phage portal protein [bacterium]